MFCPKCGKEIEEGSIFCESCGEFLRSTPEVTEPSAVRHPKVVVSTKKAFGKMSRKSVIFIFCILLIIVCTVGVILWCSGSDSQDDSTEDGLPSEITSSNQSIFEPKKLEKDVLLGDWGFIVNASKMLAVTEFETDATIKLVMRFNSNDTVQLLCTPEDYVSAYNGMLNDYLAFLRNGGIYRVYSEQNGMTREQVDEMLADHGMSRDAFVGVLAKEMREQDPLSNKNYTDDGYVNLTDDTKPNVYTLEDNKIIFVTQNDVRREAYFIFVYRDNIITVLEGDYAEGLLNGKDLIKK